MTAKLPADSPLLQDSREKAAPAQRALLIAEIIATPAATRNHEGPDQELCRLMEHPAALYEFLHPGRAAHDERARLSSPAGPARARIASVLLPFRSNIGSRARAAAWTVNGRHRQPQVPAMQGRGAADLTLRPSDAAQQKALPFEPSPEDIRQAIDGSGLGDDGSTKTSSDRENLRPVRVHAALWWVLVLPSAIVIAIWLLLF